MICLLIAWEKAQEVVEARRKDLQMGVDRKGKETHFLYGKVFCASCGAPYKRRTLPHKRVEGETVYHKVWNCRERQKGPKQSPVWRLSSISQMR